MIICFLNLYHYFYELSVLYQDNLENFTRDYALIFFGDHSQLFYNSFPSICAKKRKKSQIAIFKSY